MSNRPAWHQHSHRVQDRYVVALRGELDVGVPDELHKLLTATIAQEPLIEMDPAAVTFIDSTVINTLITAHHRASAAERACASATPPATCTACWA